MEEDNELQDRWAQLLVTAPDADSGIVVEPAFIGILQNLSSRDAAILDKIFVSCRIRKQTTLYV